MPQVRKAAYAVHLLQNLTSSQKDNLQNTATVVLNTGNKRVGGDLSRNLLFLHKSQFSESLPSRVFFFFFQIQPILLRSSQNQNITNLYIRSKCSSFSF